MQNKQFFKTNLITSSLFFVIANLLDFLLSHQTNDWLWYAIMFFLSFAVFGPMITALILDRKDNNDNLRNNLQV